VTSIDPITFFGGLGMRIEPDTHVVIEGKGCNLPGTLEEVRILNLTGHMHSRGKRFSAYLNTLGGERRLIYEMYDWAHPPAYRYDSVTQNPEPDAVARRGGGSSGVLSVKRGETIDWECEFVNDTDEVLVFGDRTIDAEMCNLFGSYGPSAASPWRCIAW
jgi:hypothetical protein